MIILSIFSFLFHKLMQFLIIVRNLNPNAIKKKYLFYYHYNNSNINILPKYKEILHVKTKLKIPEK